MCVVFRRPRLVGRTRVLVQSCVAVHGSLISTSVQVTSVDKPLSLGLLDIRIMNLYLARGNITLELVDRQANTVILWNSRRLWDNDYNDIILSSVQNADLAPWER